MKKNRIRLTESQLRNVIKRSVKSMLNEISLNDIDVINGPMSMTYVNIFIYLYAKNMSECEILI